MNLNFIKKDGLFLKIIETIMDIFLVNFGFNLAFHLRFDFQPSMTNLASYYHILPYISITTFVVFMFLKNFSIIKKSRALRI